MIELKIEGMTCNHCAAAVSKALAAVPGVSQVVEVDAKRGSAKVEGTANAQALIAAVEDEGYSARPA
ncbi:MAG: cation transporter [Chromatiales bacterium]|jgi:copper chaperone|nr:cation transporter [Chromatiales bacterium]